MAKSGREPNLFKIILVIVVLGAVGIGALRFSVWFDRFLASGVEAGALDNIELARQLAEEGDSLKAREMLRPILARVNNPAISPHALMLQAELDAAAGNVEDALESLRAATESFPESSVQPIAAVTYANMLEENARFEDAVAVFTKVRDSAPPELRAPAINGLARDMRRSNNLQAALDLYETALRDADWHSDAWYEAAEGQGDLNVQFIQSAAPTPESKVYRVKTGDSLTSIGSKLNTTQGLLMAANGISNPNRLRPNQNLKYTPKDFRIVIERSSRLLYLLDGAGIFKVYRVGLGKPGHETTQGRYRIGNKEKDPTWYKPGGGVFEAGDPGNELGSRWLPMIPEEEGLPSDLGIHGTIKPDSVGQYSSNGCPRMYNEMVEEIYDLVVRSTPVSVVEKFSAESLTS